MKLAIIDRRGDTAAARNAVMVQRQRNQSIIVRGVRNKGKQNAEIMAAACLAMKRPASWHLRPWPWPVAS